MAGRRQHEGPWAISEVAFTCWSKKGDFRRGLQADGYQDEPITRSGSSIFLIFGLAVRRQLNILLFEVKTFQP